MERRDAVTRPDGLAWFLFSFRGRVGRAQFWRFVACVWIFGLLLATVDALLSMAQVDGMAGPVFGLLIAYPCIAVLAKRWHDRDRTAWYVLLHFIPVLGTLWTLVECGFLVGSAEANRFGPPPALEDA